MKIPATQRGAATLGVTMVLLSLCALIVLYTARASVTETAVAGNHYQATRAFEAAEAAIARLYATLLTETGRAQMLLDEDGDGWIDTASEPLDGTLEFNGATYRASIENVTEGDLKYLQITGIGCTDACSPCSTSCRSHQVIADKAQLRTLLADGLRATAIAGADVDLGGNSSVTRPDGETAIWSGDGVNLSGSGSVTTRDGTYSTPSYPAVISDDQSLSELTGDEFFDRIFGMTKAEIYQAAVKVACDGSTCNTPLGDPSLYGQIVWVTGDPIINSGTVVGSEEAPIVLIVDGEMQMRGGSELNGLIYVVGHDWHNTGGGTAQINGAVIVEGEFTTVGTLNINYDPQIIAGVDGHATLSRLPGGWID